MAAPSRASSGWRGDRKPGVRPKGRRPAGSARQDPLRDPLGNHRPPPVRSSGPTQPALALDLWSPPGGEGARTAGQPDEANSSTPGARWRSFLRAPERREEVSMMENPRPEKVRGGRRGPREAGRCRCRAPHRVPRTHRQAARRAAAGAAPGRWEYKVYKNTLVRFAAREVAEDRLDSMLTGPTAITFVQGDPAAVAKALRDYAKGHPALVLKGGLLGDKIVTGKDVEALADLPSRRRAARPTGRHASGTHRQAGQPAAGSAAGISPTAYRPCSTSAEAKPRRPEPHHRRTRSGVRARGRGRASGGSHPESETQEQE